MSIHFWHFNLKKSFFVGTFLMLLLTFGCFLGKAKGEQITLVASEKHKEMGETITKLLQQKFAIKLLILPLDKLVDIVAKSKTDIFIISAAEIYYTTKFTKINLAEKGRAVASADVAEKVHLTTLVKTGIKDIEDLDDKLPDKPLSLGPKNSASESHANESIDAQRRVKGPKDFKCKDKGGCIKCQNDRFDEQAKKLVREEIKAYYVTGEVPVPSVEEVAETNELELAKIPEEIVNEMNKISLINKYIQTTIDMNDYKSDKKKVSTAGIPAAVAVTDRVDEKTVWTVTSMLLLKNPFIPQKTLPDALTAIQCFMRYHPTSLNVFKEFGVKMEPWQR